MRIGPGDEGSMEITDVRIRKVEGNDKLKAYATVLFDDELAIHNIKIIESQNGLYIAMPSKAFPDGTHKDIAHPINSAFRAKLSEAVLSQYASSDLQ